MTMLLALDPGIDITGWAALKTDGPRSLVLQQAAGRLITKGSLRTATDDELDQRLVSLSVSLRAVIEAQDPAWVAVERPAIGRTYARHEAVSTSRTGAQSFMGATMGLMHLATGALILTARSAGCEVILYAASGRKKVARHQDVYLVWPHLRHASNADERDALWIGLQLVTDTRRRWEVA